MGKEKSPIQICHALNNKNCNIKAHVWSGINLYMCFLSWKKEVVHMDVDWWLNKKNKIRKKEINMDYLEFGGQYVPQQLKQKLDEIKKEFDKATKDNEFIKEYNYYLKQYIGRPSPLYLAKNLTDYAKGAKIYLKREDLNHTGAHKINNAIGQALIAKRMNKKHIIAETGAGQHGVATATVCALFNIKCTIFMGKEDIKRQHVNVQKMKLLGAKVYEVKEGNGTLKEAVDVAFNYLLEHEDVFYLIGSAVGPSPYPEMVKYFQKVIGEETKKQILVQERKLPKAIVACVGGGSNSIGLFADFIKDKDVELYGIEGVVLAGNGAGGYFVIQPNGKIFS